MYDFQYTYTRCVMMLWACLPEEDPKDRLGIQEGERTRECIGPHVPDGHDVSDDH